MCFESKSEFHEEISLRDPTPHEIGTILPSHDGVARDRRSFKIYTETFSATSSFWRIDYSEEARVQLVTELL